MKNKAYKNGLAIMRAQPFHKGHELIIEQMLNKCENVIIAIGSAQEAKTERNPFTFEERKSFIEASFPNNKQIKIIPLNDLGNPPKWADYVIEEVKKHTNKEIEAYFCGDNENGDFFKNKIPHIEHLQRDKAIFKEISGTKIRELMKENKNINQYIPNETKKIINTLKKRTNKMQNQIEEKNSNLVCDLYHLEMIFSKFIQGTQNQESSFEMFVREMPFKGEYLLTAGQNEAIDFIKNFEITEADYNYLENEFGTEFADMFANFKPELDIDIIPEGNLAFPNETIMRLKGPEWQCLFFETMILNRVNAQSLFATKASRLVQAANGKGVSDMSLRRAQDKNGMQVARGAIIGGVTSTSNVKAGIELDLPIVGTIAHAYITSFGDTPDAELEAFIAYLNGLKASGRGHKAILLIDTFDTINSGLQNAMKASRITGVDLVGVRLDSGDNVELSKECKRQLIENGFNNTKVFASNDLDENSIQEIEENGGEIDVYGVGTKLGTSGGSPALGGVYKLKSNESGDKIKLSENAGKTINPGDTDSLRLLDKNGDYLANIIVKSSENFEATGILEHPLNIHKKDGSVINFDTETRYEKSQINVMTNGEITNDIANRTPVESRDITLKNMKKFDMKYKNFKNPEKYNHGISSELFNQKNEMINNINFLLGRDEEKIIFPDNQNEIAS